MMAGFVSGPGQQFGAMPLPYVQVLSWPPYLHKPDPVLSSLHGIFLQLAQQGGPHAELTKRSGARAPRPAVDAGPLREALARLPGRALRLGEPPANHSVSS